MINKPDWISESELTLHQRKQFSQNWAKILFVIFLKRLLLPIALIAVTWSLVFAHPEDEFCTPGEDGLDPALCQALAEMDSANPKPGTKIAPAAIDQTLEGRGFFATLSLYITIGIGHILPDGLDHILFVLALFLASIRLKALVIQISSFTVAHTVTLGLAAAGVIAPPAFIVEPFIAFTIAFVAIENIFFSDMTRWRPGVVFLFGLVHGLGFAGFFGEFGLPTGQFWSALIGFNIGVEIGQLSVVVLAYLLARILREGLARYGKSHLYRSILVIPSSVVIGLVGLWWTVQRILAT